MPAGRWLTREIRCGETPDELRARVLSTLTPQFERAGLRLVEPGDPTILYQRRYLPGRPLLLALLLVVAGGYPAARAIDGDPRVIWPLLAACVVGAMVLALARRSETLGVTVLARAGGSVALVAGYANESARASIQRWSPPRWAKLKVVPAQAVRTADRPLDWARS